MSEILGATSPWALVPQVRQDLSEWLKWLRSVGYDGWRFDYVKGYSGEFTRKYIDASVPLLVRV